MSVFICINVHIDRWVVCNHLPAYVLAFIPVQAYCVGCFSTTQYFNKSFKIIVQLLKMRSIRLSECVKTHTLLFCCSHELQLWSLECLNVTFLLKLCRWVNYTTQIQLTERYEFNTLVLISTFKSLIYSEYCIFVLPFLLLSMHFSHGNRFQRL